jgi:hypothetical protein
LADALDLGLTDSTISSEGNLLANCKPSVCNTYFVVGDIQVSTKGIYTFFGPGVN